MKIFFQSLLASTLLLGALNVASAAGAASNASSAGSSTGSTSTNSSSAAVMAPVLPYLLNQEQQPADKPLVTTSGNTCRCAVAETSGNACMIFMRSNSYDWIMRNAPQTRMRSSNEGRYYDTPFDLAASACAGRAVNPATVKVHWLDHKSAILEWK